MRLPRQPSNVIASSSSTAGGWCRLAQPLPRISPRAEAALGWTARYDFEAGLEHTLRWYLANESWWGPIRARRYAGQRLGQAAPAAGG
jgi:hypothetical protein